MLRLGVHRGLFVAATLQCLLATAACTTQPEYLEVFVGKPVQILNIQFDKVFYSPGEPLNLTVNLASEQEQQQVVWLVASISHLSDALETFREKVDLSGGNQAVGMSFLPPEGAPRGFGIDLYIETDEGYRLASLTSAFDVLNHWTESPRYGFLSEFGPGRDDSQDTMKILNRYKVNALQFYDWMYRHEQLLTSQEPYIDLLGRQLSRNTVDSLIRTAHEHNIACMPYTAVYGSSLAFQEEHREWALLDQKGQPVLFGENFMAIMDPRPGSPWTAYLLAQFEDVLVNTDFDGIHIDQYGDPKVGFDQNGERFDLAPALADFINTTKEIVRGHRPNGGVVFNAVTNWPIETVAPADQDIVYIEVWDPYNWFIDLHHLVVQAQALGNGKPVVLAAYIDPAHEHNVRLMDAIIFASGGGHIELGERFDSRPGMLADPYFPQFKGMSSELAEAVQRLYEFSIRYQDVIGPRTVDATSTYQNHISIQGTIIPAGKLKDTIFPVIRNGGKSGSPGTTTAINLINLLGVKHPEWKVPVSAAPVQMDSIDVQISEVEGSVTRIWYASPDDGNLAAQELDFQLQDGKLSFQVPSLKYWTMIVIEWSE